MNIVSKPAMAALTSLVILGACAAPGTYNPNDPNQNMRQGALIGAAAGAAAGLATGETAKERRNRALAGAAIGAAGGAAIGANLDRQAAELQASLDSRVAVVNTGNELIVRMPQDILFAVDSATVQPGLQADLRTLAASLQRYPNTTVEVVGHTDNTGTAAYNQGLSERRALAVTSILQASGVPSSRLRAIGAGESQPIASNLTAEGRAQNRRVEITIRPN